MVQRVADRVDAHLALDKPKSGKAHRCQLGSSTFTTPRMIAAHHALAIAFGRMLDETGLTGQTTFRAEFDLTAERRNIYPALPDLSGASRRLRNSLSKVAFPQAVMEEARRHKEDYETNLPLHRECEVMATFFGKKARKVTGFASVKFGEKWKVDEAEESEDSDEFLPGEEGHWEVADVVTDQLRASLSELPGCQLLSIAHKAPVPA